MIVSSFLSRILPFLIPTQHHPDDSSASLPPNTISLRAVHAHATDSDSYQLLFHDPPVSKHSSSGHFGMGGGDEQGELDGFVDPSASDLRGYACNGQASESEWSARCDFSITTVPTQSEGIQIRTRKIPIVRARAKHNATVHPFTHPAEHRDRRRNLFRINDEGERIAQKVYDVADDWEWTEEEVEAPDVTDRETLVTLAKMTSNAYVLPEGSEWYPLDGWNVTSSFGWEKNADGLRGHVFATPDESTVLISIKGTSAGVLGTGGPTAKNDKFNDNLLFSCCCGRVDYTWTPVCDCYAGGYRCELTCLEDAVIGESVYATVGTNLYNNVSYMYPNANIWLVGHSLGGAVASLIGLSFGAPVVTFEAPGERMAAQRLHLPLPPGMPSNKTGITHVYHTADPIAMGTCTGAYSVCYAGGYAMESRCHTGESIVYDTVTERGWAVDARTHRIPTIINQLLNEDWEAPPMDNRESEMERNERTSFSVSAWLRWGWPGKKKKPEGDGGGDDEEPTPEPPAPGKKKRNPNAVPKAATEDQCVDCFRWEYGDSLPTGTATANLSQRTSPLRNARIE